MRVFDPEWVQKIQDRYGQKEPYDRPAIHSFVTEERYQGIRAEIEEWVNSLPSGSRSRAVSRLRSKDFIQPYNELAVGALLRRIGYTPEYEPSLEGLTPDWYIPVSASSPPLIVEVFTDNSPEDRQSRFWHTRDLMERVMKIQIGATVFVNVYDHVKLDAQFNRAVTYSLAWWLNQHPPIGAEMCFNPRSKKQWLSTATFNAGLEGEACLHGVRFSLVSWDANHSTLYPYGPSTAFQITSEDLSKKIAVKIDKYKKLVARMKIPFVVAVVANPWTGREFEHFAGSLVGRTVYTGAMGLNPVRMNEGLFKDESLLSAGIWLEGGIYTREDLSRDIDNLNADQWLPSKYPAPIPSMETTKLSGWEMKVIHNLEATFPIPHLLPTKSETDLSPI